MYSHQLSLLHWMNNSLISKIYFTQCLFFSCYPKNPDISHRTFFSLEAFDRVKTNMFKLLKVTFLKNLVSIEKRNLTAFHNIGTYTGIWNLQNIRLRGSKQKLLPETHPSHRSIWRVHEQNEIKIPTFRITYTISTDTKLRVGDFLVNIGCLFVHFFLSLAIRLGWRLHEIIVQWF